MISMSLYLLPTTFCASICLSRCLVDILRCTTTKWKDHNFFLWFQQIVLYGWQYAVSWLLVTKKNPSLKYGQMENHSNARFNKKNSWLKFSFFVWRMEYNWIGWKKMLRNAAFYQKPAKIKDKLFIVPSMGLYLKSFPPPHRCVWCGVRHNIYIIGTKWNVVMIHHHSWTIFRCRKFGRI